MEKFDWFEGIVVKVTVLDSNQTRFVFELKKKNEIHWCSYTDVRTHLCRFSGITKGTKYVVNLFDLLGLFVSSNCL